MAIKKSHHTCTLPIRDRDKSCLPKLPPNATQFQKLYRKLRTFFLLNTDHYKCRILFRNRSLVMEEKRRHATTNPWVIHPLSTINFIIQVLFFVTWSYVLMVRPLMVFSDNFDWGFRIVLSHVIVPIQVILIALLFDVGYVEPKTDRIITKPIMIVTRYLKSYFIFDLVSSFVLVEIMTLVTDAGYVKCSLKTLRESYCFEIFVVISISAGFLRVPTLLKYTNEILAHFGVRKLPCICVIYSIKTYLYVHAMAFIFYLVPFLLYRGNWPEMSWLAQAKLDHGDPLYNQYFECFIMAICYFFGIDSRFSLYLVEEQVYASVVMVIGRLYTLYLLADILNFFGLVGVSESLYEKQIMLLHHYMIAINVPPALKRRMLMYYEFKYQRRFFKEQVIMSNLSEMLRAELFLFAARKMIQKVEFFKRLPNTAIGTIVSTMRTEIFSPRDVILRAGFVQEEVFFISTGTVCVMSKNGVELVHLEDGDCFGIGCVIAKEQGFTIVAVETTEVFIISKRDLLKFLSDFPNVEEGFVRSVKTQIAKFKDLETKLHKGKFDLFHDLETGNILEERTRRITED